MRPNTKYRLCSFLAKATNILGVFGGWCILDWTTEWALALTVCIALASILVHEFGHVVGARLAGMFVWEVRWCGFQFRAMRPFWQFRFRSDQFRLDGKTLAFVDPDRPLRRQMVMFILGGPGANALTAAAAFIAATTLDARMGIGIALAIGLVNLAFVISNLIPLDVEEASDGERLRRVLRMVDETDEAWSWMRVSGYIAHGRTMDEIPESLRQQLPPILPMLSHIVELGRLMARGEWAEAAAREAPLNETLGRIDAASRYSIDMLEFSLRMNIRCARALAGLPMGPRPKPPQDDLEWNEPGLLQRVEAIEAMERGDAAMARRKLAESEKLIARRIEGGLRRCEARIRDAVLARLEPA